MSAAARRVGWLRLARLKALWRLTRSVLSRFDRHDGGALAGYIAYAGFLAIFPFAIFATALAGALIGPEQAVALRDALFDVAPDHLAQTLAPVIDGVTSRARDGVLTVAGLGALWAASNAVEAVRVAFDRAYDVTVPRGFVKRRLYGLGFVLLASATFGVLGFLIILAPLALSLLETHLGFSTPMGLGVLRYAITAAALTFFLFQINLVLPSRRPPRRRLWPGIYVSAGLLLLGAFGFSVYLAYAPSYTVTYGAFAGVIVTLLFFYLTGAAIIIGAEVNAALMRFRRPTARERAE